MFSCLCSKVTVYWRKLQCFLFFDHTHHSTLSTDIRVSRAGSQLKIKSEEKIINLLYTEADVILPCLNRLQSLAENVTAEVLLHTSICSILYNKVYPNHNGNTDAGKLCRLLLTKFTSICEAEDDYDGEPLNITEVIVEVVEAEVNPRPVRTFRNMFTERRESVGPTNPNFCSTFVGVQSNNMEGYELNKFGGSLRHR